MTSDRTCGGVAALLVVALAAGCGSSASDPTEPSESVISSTPNIAQSTTEVAPTNTEDTSMASQPTDNQDTAREYPEFVEPVAERPSGEPIPATIFADGGPEPIPGFGTIVMATAYDPPQLSELWIRWGPDKKTESYVSVTAGDRFAIDGFVFEVVAIDSTFAQIDAWTPEQVANS